MQLSGKSWFASRSNPDGCSVTVRRRDPSTRSRLTVDTVGGQNREPRGHELARFFKDLPGQQ